MRFEGQVVLVTGAGRGIGRAIAEGFGLHGGCVACADLSAEGAAEAAEAIRRAGGSAQGFACDVSDPASVDALFDSVGASLGAPSVLVNNAGIARDALLIRMTDEDWHRVLAVNLTGAYLCCKAAVRPMMKARYGRIVNVSSVIGLGGGAGQANYAASKAGLIGLTKSVAKELGGRGITCNALAPGFIETEMTVDLPSEMRENVVRVAPAGRLGTPEDLVPGVLFLASKEAGYITGQTLVVDGGLTL